MRARLVLVVLWALALLQILTVSRSERFTLLEPLSVEALALLGMFVMTSLSLFPVPGRRTLVWLHLGVVGMLVAAHPLTESLGRDGSLVATLTYGLAVFWRYTSARGQLKLLVSSVAVGVLLVETLLSLVRDPRPGPGIVDYGDVMGPYGEGGFLLPDLHVRMVGEAGEVELVTERHGFRNREEIPREKPAGSYRILFAGDSFVAGYRVDQEEMVGRRLERSLRDRTGRRVDVLVAGSGHPGTTLDLVERHGLSFEPDLVLVGVTLGNDLSQSWMARHPYSGEVLANLMLPEDAFVQSRVALLPARLDRTLHAWRSYRRFQRYRASPITPWYPVRPGEVRLFDAGHSLGHFFVRRPLPVVERSYEDVLYFLERIAAAARASATEVLFVIFPQRFQVHGADWRATVFSYGLDPMAFDLQAPNRRLAVECERHGLPCLDLLPAFRRHADEALYLPRGDMHWNARGHAVAAEELAGVLATAVSR